MEHLPSSALQPGEPLDDAALAHLEGCARCRVEQRLVTVFYEEPDVPEVELAAVGTILDTVRGELTLSMQERSLLWVEGQTPSELVPDPDERYRVEGQLGAGGMGEVLAVHDHTLARRVAMKVASDRLQRDHQSLARFVEEAQVGAQLQHPGIVPVHDLGRLPDGRAYFTMKEIDGVTLGEAIAGVHAASSGGWAASSSGWTFRRLVDALRRVAETVGYAHSRGVAHRDLKPANVMLGPWGEVLVVDWGLAKMLGTHSPESTEVVSPRAGDDALATRQGSVAGTPGFMAPEQARGELDQVGAPADVYALGAILRVILTGRAPYSGGGAMELLARVVAGAPPAMEQRSGPLPDDLVEICERAMQRDPAARFASAGEVAEAVGAWLDGAARTERALASLAEAQTLLPQAARARMEARTREAEASSVLSPLSSFDSEAAKQRGWALEDEAAALRAEAEMLELRFTEGVRSALVHDPDLPAAHRALASHHRRAHEAAEHRGAASEAARSEVLLRAHDRGEHEDYLRGVGWLSLATDVPAQVTAVRLETRGRRLVEGPPTRLGTTPLVRVELDIGSWVLVIAAPDRAEVRLPVVIRRAETSDRLRPGAESEAVLALPQVDAMSPGDVYVPAGWFEGGGDPSAPSSLPARRVWLDAFVIQRDPVTHDEYLAFLDALVASGREEEAFQWAPRERPSKPGEPGALLVEHAPGVGFALRVDAEGDTWEPDWPAWMVSWSGARAYGRWRAEVDGLPWRLPWELEWEKAARGVDGRAWPWGDFADPTWACVHGSREGRPMPSAVGEHPVDVSVYGMRGAGGGVCDWTLDVFDEEGTPVGSDGLFDPDQPVPSADDRSRCVKGGSWSNPTSHARAAFRDGRHPGDRRWVIGFRLARSL
ncbi:MAG: SUMF1/EgtB/PvdO family nonheme iron enzyme [Deltaproteobacteria bacterium]|nr:SUMF1/EgtB/PvdO family nonheme iron enzyme [Deltaproteobacteria bacterium]